MPTRAYPDDRQDEPVQLTLSQFVQEASEYFLNMTNSRDDEQTFLKFILAGRRGLQREEQRSITLNMTQGQPNIRDITVTRDYDSLIGTTKTLPYLVPLTVWPVPSFRDTLTANNHVTSVAHDHNVSLYQIYASLFSFSFSSILNPMLGKSYIRAHALHSQRCPWKGR